MFANVQRLNWISSVLTDVQMLSAICYVCVCARPCFFVFVCLFVGIPTIVLFNKISREKTYEIIIQDI